MAAKCRKGEKNPRSAVGALSILCDSSPFHFYDCIKANENGGRCKNRNRDRGRSRRKNNIVEIAHCAVTVPQHLHRKGNFIKKKKMQSNRTEKNDRRNILKKLKRGEGVKSGSKIYL
ncbi:hypothetical protein POVCU1_060310 [Plasmodium ovale curtisi]|uniref:Uncharacterized protein n=1 Tax=Plasmodium ovale curtisi TaxID=864141 RepID=A0A1A8X7A3_PLAOA|nr:hypothetical protein POVCU1_060310 [Plasmodium ovale curtisi]